MDHRACLGLPLLLIAGAAHADPVQSEVAITVPKGAATVRSFVRSVNASGRTTSSLEWQTQLNYGLSARRNLLLLVPVGEKEAAAGGRIRSSAGLGDVSLLLKQQIWIKNSLQTQDRFAVIGGFKLPTGETGRTDRFGRLPRSLQPGTGSFDFPVGVLYAHDSATGFFADVIYTARTRADDYRVGNLLRYDLALTHAIRGGEPRRHFVWGVLELNGYINARDQAGAQVVADTGGHVLYLSPGLRLVHWTGRWVLDLSYQVPIAGSLKDRQSRPDGAFLVGVRANF